MRRKRKGELRREAGEGEEEKKRNGKVQWKRPYTRARNERDRNAPDKIFHCIRGGGKGGMGLRRADRN